jgi:thioredoxin reductase (NADPH)
MSANGFGGDGAAGELVGGFDGAELGAEVPPVLLLATIDGESRAVLDGELRRRYGADYEVVTCASYGQARAVLEELHARGRDVAMVFCCYGPADREGLSFLRGARSIDPAAKRAVVVIWGDFESAQPVFQAIAEGHAELQLVRPELRRDEEFHESITDFLGDWHLAEGSGFEAVRMIGRHDERTSMLRDAFARNHIPVGFYLADTEAGRRILASLELDGAELPVLVLQFRSPPITLVNPSDAELADAFGLMTRPSSEKVYDVVVIGAGPAGLATAVYAASEGLSTMVVERLAVGGQAGTSSLIRNYPGFARGISGAHLAFRTFQQAWAFGTEFLFLREAVSLGTQGDQRVLTLSDGSTLRSRAMVVATGVDYRRLGNPDLEKLVGRGVFYGAMVSEVPALAEQQAFVVGGGNAAGQAALYVARYARQVTMAVRGPGLAASMSEYLIEQIGATPNIDILFNTAVTGARAVDDSLAELEISHLDTGTAEWRPAAALFVLIGQAPHTTFLDQTVQRDQAGFLLAGRDVDQPESSGAAVPLPFETSAPGVFVIGDARSGSVKRVASAVGDAAGIVQVLHSYLAPIPAGVAVR